MAKLYNLARMATATTGTGTITLGSAVSGFLSFANAGVQNGDVVSYGIKDGTNSEVGTGTYTSSGTTLTRTVTKSTNSNAAISLSGSAEVFITARAEDIFNKSDVASQSDQETGASTTLAVTPGTQQFHTSAAKAWAYVTQSGGVYTLAAAYNIASLNKTAVGNIEVNFSTPFSSVNYVCIATAIGASIVNSSPTISSASKAIIVLVRTSTEAFFDASFSLVCYGDQ